VLRKWCIYLTRGILDGAFIVDKALTEVGYLEYRASKMDIDDLACRLTLDRLLSAFHDVGSMFNK